MSKVLDTIQILLAYLRPIYSDLALFLAITTLFMVAFLSLLLLFVTRLL
jgi:hypothetical protein